MAKTVLTASNLDTYFMQQHILFSKDVKDQTIQRSGVLSVLEKLGKFKSYTDASELRQRVKHEVISGQTYAKRGKIDITKHDTQTLAEWDPKHLAWSLVYYYHDLLDQGESRLYSVFDEQSRELKQDAPKLIEDQILGSGTPSSTNVEGFEFVLSNSTSTGTVGGIDRSTASNSWWRHKSIDMSSKNFPTQGLSAMQQMYTNLTYGGKGPDLMLTHDDVFNTIHDLGYAKSMDTQLSGKMKDLGFEVMTFKGATIVNSPKIASGKIMFLTTEDFDIMVHSNDDMQFHSPTYESERPGDRIFPVTKTMNIIWYRLMKQGVMHSITVNKQTIT